MKLLLTGSGKIVQELLTISKDLKNIEFVGISGTVRSKEKVLSLKEKYGMSEAYTDYDKALKETKADTVYIGVPNFLHYSFAKKALEAGKNVICEKPFTVKYSEFADLQKIALDKKLILLEAITIQYLTNYKELKDKVKDLGPIKIVSMNYSQYSSRYDAFKKGEILPVFDPKKGGGALMDLNIYNIHFLVGLFGKPKSVKYLANIQKGVDTSGILLLDYGSFKAVAIGAKDCEAPITSTIEGEDESIVVNGKPNELNSFDIYEHAEHLEHIDDKVYPHRMYEEFVEFARIIDEKDYSAFEKSLIHSDLVMQVLQEAVESAGLKLE